MLGIEITLVGAGARNVWMELGGEIRYARFTRDIDLAVMVIDHANYERLRSYFVDYEGFTVSPRFDLSLFSSTGTPVDLLPYGPIEVNNEILLGSLAKAAQVHGFREACQAAVEVNYQDQGTCRVITAGGLFLLKLIALDDRPLNRANDVDDLSLFLRLAYALFLEDIQMNHWDIFTVYEADDNFSIQVGSQYLGRKLGEIVRRNETLIDRLTEILQGHLEKAPDGAISRALVHQQGFSQSQAHLSLEALFRGFQSTGK